MTCRSSVRHAACAYSLIRPPADPRRRPGPDTGYRRIEKKTFEVTCDIDYQQVAYDAVSDGCWPLITNDWDMTGAEVLAAYRYQPNLERRHHLLKDAMWEGPPRRQS